MGSCLVVGLPLQLASFVLIHLIIIRHFLLFRCLHSFITSIRLLRLRVTCLDFGISILLLWRFAQCFRLSLQTARSMEYLVIRPFAFLIILLLLYNPNQFCSQLKRRILHLFCFHCRDSTKSQHLLVRLWKLHRLQ